MKNQLSKFTILMLAITFALSASLLAQNKPMNTIQEQDHPSLGPDKNPGTTPAPQISEQVQALMNQQKQAKLNGNLELIKSLQQQIDQVSGESVTIPAIQGGITKFVGNDPHYQGDNIINNRVFTNPSNSFIKATAIDVEQRGSNIGRIWMCVAWGNSTTGVPDTILTSYSDNGGLTFTGYSLAIPGGFAKVNADQFDMEIMEYTTGQKYVYTVMGVTANTGQQVANVLIYQTPTYAGNFLTLVWPGGTGNTNTYRPRVTSDNSNYPTTSSYLFILAARDTLNVATNQHIIGEKFVKCISPFTVNPTFTYKSNPFGYNLNYGGVGTYYAGADHCDIAYYQNGGSDSLIVLESDVPDTTAIYLYRSDESPELVGGSLYYTFLNSNLGSFQQKQYARVTCNGNSNIMIAYRCNFNNSGDWDIRYANSTAGGLASSNWSNGYIDGYGSTTTVPYQPDIFGLRSTSSFKCTYTYYNSGLDSAMMVSAPNGTWGSAYRMNLTGNDVSISASPHACFRFVSNDSCFADWSEYSANNVWSAAGCTGSQLTGINNQGNVIPKTYSLAQNYPNPFNPSTSIKFNIPQSGNVKLAVYDLLGNVVATLVNGRIEAGVHEISFDASNIASGVYFYKIEANGFSDVKKMMLIK